MNIKDLVKDNKQATFTHFRRGQLWYVTDCGFSFPVPVDDVGDATFSAQEKAMLLMRYMRKHIADMAEGKGETT